MNFHRALGLLLCCTLFVTAGCEQTSIAEQELPRTIETIQAGTPTVTPTPTPTATPEPTATPTPTVGPSPTPQPTPIPSPTPLPPTPTPNPALADFSLCNQTAGDPQGGRFSASITGITTTVEANFERITVGLDVPGDSARPHALVRCLSAADDAAQGGDASEGYVLLVELNGWLQDDLFRDSAIQNTTELTGTERLERVELRVNETTGVGATLAIPLDQPYLYRVSLAENASAIVLDVADTSPINPSSDGLRLPSQAEATPDQPLFYLQDGDIWKLEDGQATNLTDTPEAETALAVNLDAGLVAYCQAVAGADVNDTRAISTLWTMDLEGEDQEEIAAAGLSCYDPVISPDGGSIAFAVDETGATPQRLSIWTVTTDGGTLERVTARDDEWSRFAPQWLDDERLVYAAEAEDGRSTLFLLDGDAEQDIGAELVLGDRYRALGRPLVAPDGSGIAVEALRVNRTGADLVLLDADGAERDTVSNAYWVRPVAWNADGTLFYLTSACESDAVLDYTLHALDSDSNDRLLATGITTGGYAGFQATGDGLAYVGQDRPLPGPRGSLSLNRATSSSLWFWDLRGGQRSQLVEAESGINL